MPRGFGALALALWFGAAVHAQQAAPRSPHVRATVHAVRAVEPPVIDGRLSDGSWSHADIASGFTERDPDEGKPATEPAEVRVLFDDDAVYFGVRMYDSAPDQIATRLSNRDDVPDADYVVIYLDPRHDHLTGVEFCVSAAGVQRDSVISNDTNENSSWDAVWSSAVSIDDQGWSAELRIPLSQLRFTAADRQTWGINVSRFIRRKNETSWLELVLKNENGLASRMVELTGLDGIQSGRHLEVAPYSAVRQELIRPESGGDPFNDGSRLFGAVGLDLKTRLSSGLTLDATINPDFGQAEVDPAVVNLTAFETFFDEKRRFFIEGSEIFNNFGMGGSNNFFGFNTSDPNIFYSRRIGRVPHETAEGDFVDAPNATTILGAVKVTGKTANGWSIGVIDAVTDRERARTISGTVRGTTEVEPFTNYFVARLQHDFSRGGAGMLATSVVRNLDTPLLKDTLASRASVFGADAFYFFDRTHDWVVTGKLSGSHVTGSETAVATLQRAPQRYYQRPDAPEVSFDPARRSLSGYAGRVNLNRNSGVWRVNAALWGVSPGFESNDLGFHGSSDRAGGHVVLLWRKQASDRWTRARGIWVARAAVWTFNRDVVSSVWFTCGNATLLNYWSVNGCAGYSYRAFDDQLTRGGPMAVNPRSRNANASLNTDSRKRLSIELDGSRDANAAGGWTNSGRLMLNVKPLPSLTISTGPNINRSRNLAQYIQTEPDPGATATFGQRYVFATLDQTQVTLTTRVNYILTPRASLQVYMQPLLAAGGYRDFKELAAPRTFDFREYGAAAGAISRDPIARTYDVDPVGPGPAPSFSFDDPDFNLKSLRLNAVLRWEFRPGSTLYGVWIQEREDSSHPGQFQFRRDAATLFSAPSNNVFLVKLTYWIGR